MLIEPACCGAPYTSTLYGFKIAQRRIASMKVKELIAMLEADGWYQVRMKGSHRQFHHPTKRGTVTVAGKPSVDVPPGTLNSALKQAGLKK
jgi:predicted RNA binding protein YcfA (HicA-like mRNA interferase family)